MWERCTLPSHTNWKNYGARGITVCERWASFEAFIQDMGERPKRSTIERLDNSKGYFPDNCRWATAVSQARNRRSTLLSLDGALELIGRIEHGESAPSVALRLGVTVATVHSICHARNWADLGGASTRRPRPAPITDEQLSLVEQLRASGEKMDAIAARIGVRRTSLNRKLRNVRLRTA